MPWSYVQQDDGADCVAQKIIQLRTWQIQHHRFCSVAPRQSTKLFG